ncbi:MAG TPA: hypothetical protein VFP98_00190, partial [Candidatus Polarisedimenticolia bacterium]|nr:hypothetical protein [Candidatus Polarisedimenticolia bacterium]
KQFIVPNGAPDLYVLNTNWFQVLRTGNFNRAEYTSTELSLRKRLHRNWQMFLSYTYSKALGEAESFTDFLGNDPAASDIAPGFLDFDQRHILKWQGVTHLPGELLLGATVQWASGLPYSLVSTVVDHDDFGNLSGRRTFFPTGVKNDERNEGQWLINARLEKRIHLGKWEGSAFLSGENLLDDDHLRVESYNLGQGAFDGTRSFGRRYEIGVALLY